MRRETILPIAIGVPVALGLWFVMLLGMALVAPPGRPLAVVAANGAGGALGAVVAAGGAIVQVRGDTVIAIGDAPGFATRLYRAGALVVMPARTGGCIVAAG